MIPAGATIAGYVVDGVLGQGSMGTVYEAYQVSLKRRVALKLLAGELGRDEAFKERFRREGVRQATVDHPHIVPVYEAGESPEGLFLAMRLIRGPTLKRLIIEGGLDPDTAVRLLTPVAAALDAAHAQGLIHRDVKPHNILIETGEHPYLSDFGLTKAPEDITITGTGIVGTPAYAAPEQLDGAATRLSDIYSLGAVLSECLTGTVPFPRDSQVAVIFAHLHDLPPRASDRRVDLPKGLDRTLAQALAKDPEERPQSAQQLIDEIARSIRAPESRSVVNSGTTGPFGSLGEATGGRDVSANPPGVRRSTILLLAVLTSVLGLTGLAFAVAGQDGGLSPTPTLVPLLAVLCGLAAFVALLVHRRRLRSPRVTKVQPDPERKQRVRLLNRVSQSYATYLEQSLQYTVRLEPGMDRVPAETFRESDRLLPVHRRRERLADGTSLLQVFDDAGGLSGAGVLVLGGPGAGKTTLLVEFGLQLTERTRNDPMHPVPVYLPLSTWGVRRPRFDGWVVDQLQELYQLPSPLATAWLEQERGELVLLLDGLDEVAGTEARAACIAEIDRFGRDYRVPVVVTSRRAEYETLGARFQLETAVLLRPLDPARVLAHLRERGSEMAGIVGLVEQDPRLCDLLTSPLVLSMLTLACVGEREADILLQGAEEERLERLIAEYFSRRLELERQTRDAGPSESNAYPPERTRRWLAALARGLSKRRQTIFLLERLRSDLLPSRPARRFVVVAPKLVFGVAAGVLQFAVDGELSRRLGFDDEPVFHLLAWPLLGLVAGLVGDRTLRYRSIAWGCLGIACGLIFSRVIHVHSPVEVLVQVCYFTCLFAVVGELMVRLIPSELEPAERLSWSWGQARPHVARGLVLGVLAGPLFGLVFGLSIEHQGGSAAGRWFWLFAFGPVMGLLWGLSRGVGKGLNPAPRLARAVPNEGIRRSGRHGALVALVTLAIVEAIALAGYGGSLLFGSGAGPLEDPIVVLLLGSALGAGCGLLLGIASGLGATIQHFTIRFFLWRYNLAPLRYVRWLSYAVRLRILYWGVGGGHIFIHGVVQEHFATLADPGDQDSYEGQSKSL